MHVSQRKLTIPNALTIVRGLAIPWLFVLILDNPGQNWWIAGIFALSDNVDGALARLGDRSATLRSFGLRRSESGRKWDPIVDKLFAAAIILAGVMHGAILLWLGGLALVQKAAVAAVAVTAQIRGDDFEVTKTGKYGEFLSVVGFGLLLAAEAIGQQTVRDLVRGGAVVLALSGIALAVYATFVYLRKTRLLPGVTDR